MRRIGLSIGVIIVIVTLFMWVNTDVLFGPYAEQAKNVLLVYILMLTFTLAALGVRLPTIQTNLVGLVNFLIGFGITLAILLPLRFFAVFASSFEIITAVSFGFLYAFIKAFIEEVVFRDLLPLKAGLGDKISSVLFGLFHFSMLWALGASLQVMIGGFILLSLLGYVWSQVRNYLGLMGSTGSHFAYNAIVLGAISV